MFCVDPTVGSSGFQSQLSPLKKKTKLKELASGQFSWSISGREKRTKKWSEGEARLAVQGWVLESLLGSVMAE